MKILPTNQKTSKTRGEYKIQNQLSYLFSYNEFLPEVTVLERYIVTHPSTVFHLDLTLFSNQQQIALANLLHYKNVKV